VQKKDLRGAAITFSYRLVQFAHKVCARDRVLSFEIGGADAEDPPRLLLWQVELLMVIEKRAVWRQLSWRL